MFMLILCGLATIVFGVVIILKLSIWTGVGTINRNTYHCLYNRAGKIAPAQY